jgi:hypothetical protein
VQSFCRALVELGAELLQSFRRARCFEVRHVESATTYRPHFFSNQLEADFLTNQKLAWLSLNSRTRKYRPLVPRVNNSNTLKNRDNRTKRLALLGRCPSRKPKMRMWLAKTDTKTRNTVMPPTHQLRSNALSSWHREL